MLQIQTANLSQDQKRRLHADFLADEQAYLKMRNGLLDQYRGQWVAIQNSEVIAASTSLLAVMEKVAASGGHPYVALVGAEDAAVFRVRRTVFPYDSAYQPFALPRVIATFWNHAQTRSQTHGDVIPDTGSDVSLLPDADCQAIDLFNSPYMLGRRRCRWRNHGTFLSGKSRARWPALFCVDSTGFQQQRADSRPRRSESGTGFV